LCTFKPKAQQPAQKTIQVFHKYALQFNFASSVFWDIFSKNIKTLFPMAQKGAVNNTDKKKIKFFSYMKK
jgi:hypothetical protein